LTVAALASIGAGGIHIAAATTLGKGDAQTFAFFAGVAVAQIVWGLVSLVTVSRWWLILGALGNAGVVATWAVSRTVGLPIGEFAHEVLPVGYADVLATILGAVTIVGAVVLLVRASVSVRAAARARGVALAAAIVIGLLAVSGIMSQANATSGGGGQSGSTSNGGGAYGGYGGSGSNGGYGSSSGSSGTTSNGGGY
jgi:hypothetical protein